MSRPVAGVVVAEFSEGADAAFGDVVSADEDAEAEESEAVSLIFVFVTFSSKEHITSFNADRNYRDLSSILLPEATA